MLIDSGADVTLLPRSDVGSLGVVGEGETYKLMAFDGTISEAEVVRVDLSFRGRKFRGRFLLLDAEIGVLGRDILIHLRLLLRRPSLALEDRSVSNGKSIP